VILLDSSAVLCFLLGETGGDTVDGLLSSEEGCSCSAANWCEVAQKFRTRRQGWMTARSVLLGDGLVVVPVTVDDAETAARLWRRGTGLSLADRLCLATAERLDAVVWTADAAWGKSSRVRQIR